MKRFNSPLDDVRIAAPCKADWQQMIGTDRVRFCSQCNLNVYNLSSMTKLDAETFITRNEGRLCVRFYRRADGSILTENCPVGLRAIRSRLSRFARATASAFLGFMAGLGLHHTSVQEPTGYVVMGDMTVLEKPGPWVTGELPTTYVDTKSRGERQLVRLGRVVPVKRTQRLRQVPSNGR